MIFECVVILAVHNYCHPYLRARANLAEFVYLLVLCALAISQIIEGKQAGLEVAVMVLLVILACYTLIVLVCKATHFFPNRFRCARSNGLTSRRGYDEIESTEADKSLSIETQRQRSNLNVMPQPHSQGRLSSRRPGRRVSLSDSSEKSWEHAGQC